MMLKRFLHMFTHNWSDWSGLQTYPITCDGKCKGTWSEQQRYCQTCGFVQRKVTKELL